MDKGWQHISTAPLDGTRVLLAVTKKDGSGQNVFAGEYHHGVWRVAKVTHSITGIVSYIIVERTRITHWQPSPEMPVFLPLVKVAE